eukprot:1163944-Heterocapsa_arctica.AAC.1
METIPDKKWSIVEFLGQCKQDDPDWHTKTNLEKLAIIGVYLADKPNEREQLAKYGAVRLSRAEALD